MTIRTSICRLLVLTVSTIAPGALGIASADTVVESESAATPQYIERTVMRPQMVTETKMCTVTEYRNETREREYTVYKRVAETSARSCDVTVMVPEQRTRVEKYTVMRPVTRTVTQTYKVQVPVWQEVPQSYTVQVPQVEVRQAYRTTCRKVPVTVMKTVCRDAGCWVNKTAQVPACDPCGRAVMRTVCRPVYVPKMVFRAGSGNALQDRAGAGALPIQRDGL